MSRTLVPLTPAALGTGIAAQAGVMYYCMSRFHVRGFGTNNVVVNNWARRVVLRLARRKTRVEPGP